MCVSNKVDSDKDFKGKVGDEDEVVGKIQNDKLSTVQTCFIFVLKIEYLKVSGRICLKSLAFFKHFDVCEQQI